MVLATWTGTHVAVQGVKPPNIGDSQVRKLSNAVKKHPTYINMAETLVCTHKHAFRTLVR